MSIHLPHVSTLTHKVVENRRNARGRRELARAIANAPTQASRDELISLAYR